MKSKSRKAAAEEMKAVKRKLNSDTGASLIISLMYYLVVMMVGLVCIVAAYNNVGRMTHVLPDQQEYHAVESAIKLITEDMKQAEFLLKANYKDNGELSSYTVEENKNEQYGKIVSCLLGEGTGVDKPTYNPALKQGKKMSFSLNLSGAGFSGQDSTGTVGDKLNVKGDITFGYTGYKTSVDEEEDDPDFTLIISLWEEKESENTNGESGEGTGDNETDTNLQSNKTILTFSPLIQEIKVYDAINQTSETKLRISWMDEPMIENEDLRPDDEDSAV